MIKRDLKERTTTTASATVNYDLPQWNGEDVTSWMTNLNDAFNKIDSAMWANHTAMAGYDKIASDLQKLADGIKVDNAEIREALRIVQQGMADQLTQLNQAKTDITNANLAISQLQTEDNALSAMIEDLQDDVGMLGGNLNSLTTRVDNLEQGNSSGNIMEKIEELEQRIDGIVIPTMPETVTARKLFTDSGVDFYLLSKNVVMAVYKLYVSISLPSGTPPQSTVRQMSSEHKAILDGIERTLDRPIYINGSAFYNGCSVHLEISSIGYGIDITKQTVTSINSPSASDEQYINAFIIF